MDNKYKYLFPYDMIPHGSRIIIYGAGDVGQEYLQQMLLTGYAEVLCFLDKSYDKLDAMILPVYPIEKVSDFTFDFIVLAFKRGDYARDVRLQLVHRGISEEKIVYQGPRNACPSIFSETQSIRANCCNFAYQKSNFSIALKYGPGLGDAIIKKRFFMELSRMAEDALIDIYSPGSSRYISPLYSDQKRLNSAIDDGGALYVENSRKYTLSMSVYRLVEVDYIDYEKLEQCNPLFAEKIRTHIENHKVYGLSSFPFIHCWIHCGRALYNGWDCYTFYQYTDVFRINDKNVPIPLDISKKDIYEDMELFGYITLNYGNGTGSKENKRKISKQWPKENFNKFIHLFREKFSDIKIVQVGDDATELLENVDQYVIGKELGIVEYVLKGAIFHLDIEGGLVHLATQLGTKCIVLFGPTSVKIFGYEQNINIVSDRCNGCYGLYDSAFACAKGMEEPECMWGIEPEVVMERAEAMLSKDAHFDRVDDAVGK